MEQIEVISWKTLDALKKAATKIIEIIGDIDTNEQMAVFCSIEEDYIELYYSEVDSSYIRHFEDEDELYKYIEKRKNEFGEEDYDSADYFDDENFTNENSGENFDGYSIKEEDESDEY